MNRCWLALSLVTLSLLLASLPDIWRQAAMQAVGSTRSLRPLGGQDQAPEGSAASHPSVDPLDKESLWAQLREADQELLPRAEPLDGGGVRYLYKRRAGEPELSIPEIKDLIANPTSTEPQRLAIAKLLDLLERSGVSISLSEPIKSGAAAEWDPQQSSLRIRPDVPELGSLEFAKVINHEAIHVAQSCAAGGLRSSPRPLGIAKPLTPALADQLNQPLYADLRESDKEMELEAYSHQDQSGLSLALVRLHCRNGQA